MKTTVKYLFLLATGAVCLTACEIGDPETIKTTYVAVVVNEGNFNDHNGSVDYYDEETAQIYRNPLKTSLGATYQSAMFWNYLWITCNAPDKIVAFDAISGNMLEHTITNSLISPRYTDHSGVYLFVSNWGEPVIDGEWEPGIPKKIYPDSYVSVYDATDNYTFYKKLPCGYDAEGIKIYENRLFVATKEGVKVFDIGSSSMPEIQTITSSLFSGSAKHFVMDASNKMWVSYTDGGLLCFDPKTFAVLKEYPASLDTWMGKIAITKDRNKVVSYATTYDADFKYTGAALYAIDLSTGVQQELFHGAYLFYSIGVSPFSGDIYTADTQYNENSMMMVFNESGEKKKEIASGPGTGFFTFFYIERLSN